jgi:hypothetical protein
VITTLLLAGRWLWSREGGGAATLLTCALAALYVPAFEWAAVRAGWWEYRDVAMVVPGVPVYIVVGEALMALPIAWLGAHAHRLRPRTAALAGVGLGLGIALAYGAAIGGERLVTEAVRVIFTVHERPALVKPLQCASGLLWLVAYASLTYRSLRDRRCAVPGAALAATIAWEFFYTLKPIEGSEHWKYMHLISALWFLFDVPIVASYLRFEHPRRRGSTETPLVFYGRFLLIGAVAVVFYAALEARLRDQAAHSALGLNVFISAMWLARLGRDGQVAGQSLWMAISKCAGTACAALGIYFAFVRTEYLLLAFTATVLLFDLAYIALLVKACRRQNVPLFARF